MTWFQQSANGTEADKENVTVFIAVSMTFASGSVRVWSGLGDLTFGGNTYVGAGQMGSVSAHIEQIPLLAAGKTFRLSGTDPSLVLESDFDSSFGRSVTEYFGFLNSAGQLVATPEINWEGRIDSCRRVDGIDPFIEVSAEFRLVLVEKPDGWRYTHEHQQQFFPGDFGLQYMGVIETSELLWGGRRVYPGQQGGGPGTGRKSLPP